MNMHVLLAGKFHNFATRETLLWERDYVLLVCVFSHFSCVQLFAALWSVAHQAPMSMDSLGKNSGVGCHNEINCNCLKILCVCVKSDNIHRATSTVLTLNR